MSYQVMDAMIERDNRLTDFATEYFVGTLIGDVPSRPLIM